MNPKKLQLLQAAKELFIQRGFSDTSVSDIIKQANISKGTFYNHFSSKNDCLIAILQDVHDRSVTERKNIAHIHNPHDLATLEKELVVHFTLIIESNIMDIMTNNLSSKDHQEICNLIKFKSLYEVKWLGRRLTEIYGPYIKNNAYDFAAMILGSIQHITLIRTILVPSDFSIEAVVGETLRRFEPGIYATTTSNETLVPGNIRELENEEC